MRCAAIVGGVMAAALGWPAAAQVDEGRVAAMVSEAQIGLMSADPVERRDRLVEAAYQARRLVEDAPESDAAQRLLGAGFEVFGGDPIRYATLHEALVEACIAAPSALCLVDVAYAMGAQFAEPKIDSMIETRKELDLDDAQIHAAELSEFRAQAAIAYAELGLPERVRATYAHHTLRDGALSLLNRIHHAPDFAYALARIGEEGVEKRIISEIEAAVPHGVQELASHLSMMPDQVSAATYAARLVSNEGSVWPYYPIDSLTIAKATESLAKYHTWNASARLLGMLESLHAECAEIGPLPAFRCADSLARARALHGNVDQVLESAPGEEFRQQLAFSALPLLVQAGQFDMARHIYETEIDPEERPWHALDIAAISDLELLAEVEDWAQNLEEEDARVRGLAMVAGSWAMAGHPDEARRVAAQVPQAGTVSGEALDLVSFQANGLAIRGEYSEAIRLLRSSAPTYQRDLAVHGIAQKAVRDGVGS